MKRFLCVCMALTLLTVYCACQFSAAAEGESEMTWLEGAESMSNAAFAEGRSAVRDAERQRRSIYSWSMVLLNDGAFHDLSRMLVGLGINRVYQEIPKVYFSQADTAIMVQNLADLGIETVYLTGDRDWLFDGLEDYCSEIDALCAYNEGIGAAAPIKAVALDVESYTLAAWEEAPEEHFEMFVERMEEAYRYAHERGLSVIQVIPEHLDTISRETFEEFVRRCCDEVSVMNYCKGQELWAIWNEVLVCRELGKPIESIFETMPLNEYYSVTEEKTYFYDGLEALQAAEKAVAAMYGDSLGISYHHYQTMFRLYTGEYLAEIYPYTAKSDPGRNEYSQPLGLESVLLTGDDGSLQIAYRYSPNLAEETSEVCFLAVGVQEGVRYTVTPRSEAYRVTGEKELAFEIEEGEVFGAEAIHVRPKK